MSPLSTALPADSATEKNSEKKADVVNIFQQLIDELPGVVYMKNQEGQIILANKNLEPIIGQPASAAIGKTDAEILGIQTGREIRQNDLRIWHSAERSAELIEEVAGQDGVEYYASVKKIVPNFVQGTGEALIGFSSNATKRVEAERALAETTAFMAKMQDLSPNIVFLLDLETRRISRSNRAFERILGYRQKKLEREPRFWFSIMSSEDKSEEKIRFDKLRRMRKDEIITKEIRYRKAGGGYLWTKTMITPFEFDSDGEVQVVMVSIENIHRVKSLQEKYRRESYYDHLTRIYNRRFFTSQLAERLRGTKTFTLLFFDLNKFKEINDTYGHDMGDRVLIDTAKRLRTVFRRKRDIVARLGGDEFVVMIDGVLQHGTNKSIIRRLKSQYMFPFRLGKQLINYRPSIGAVAIDPDEYSSPELVLQQADAAMYEAKKLKKLEVVTLLNDQPKVLKEENVEMIEDGGMEEVDSE